MNPTVTAGEVRTLRSFLRLLVAVSAVLAGGAYLWRGLDFSLGVLLGSAIIVLNLVWTIRVVQAVMVSSQPKTRLAFSYVSKLGLTAVVLLVALYTMADWRSVARTIAGLDPGYLAPALILFVPQTLVSAARWRFLATPVCRISLLEGTRQTLAASALNLVIP
ncbi:MAG: ATP synthase subunit I, partial [SAR324 cluster bacterium]|nr:ATP synthase subunit I [SAR324 cluster bacterium]